MRPRVEIRYCPLCGWLMRSAWMAQELLTTFVDDVGEVALVPAGKGEFVIRVNDTCVWDRHHEHGFPDIRTLKQRIRDQVCPERSLGHLDRATPSSTESRD